MKKIVMLVPIAEDPTSWYRGFGPFGALQKSLAETSMAIEFVLPPTFSWPPFKLGDVFFMQRPAVPAHFQHLIMAKDMGLKVWVDFDDDNLSVPRDNPMFPVYGRTDIKEAIVRIARAADVISVSTETLKEKYKIYNKNIVVVPNALDECLYRLRQIPPNPREKSFLWRGTLSHQKNLRTLEKEIISVAKRHEDWRFVFFGCEPIDITEVCRNTQVVGTCDIINFYKAMCGLHSSVVFYPLAENPHAQSRSHISWLEATFAGSLTLAYKNAEFTRPGILNFQNPKEFEDHCEAIIKGDVDIDKHVQESWDAIQEKYVLSKVNLIRKSILESLL